MNIEKIINEVKESISPNNNIDDNIVFKSFQVPIFDGFFGSVINEKKKTHEYEVFSYLKCKFNIASPIRLKKFKTKEKAIDYFNEILEIVNTNNPDEIIKFCKKNT